MRCRMGTTTLRLLVVGLVLLAGLVSRVTYEQLSTRENPQQRNPTKTTAPDSAPSSRPGRAGTRPERPQQPRLRRKRSRLRRLDNSATPPPKHHPTAPTQQEQPLTEHRLTKQPLTKQPLPSVVPFAQTKAPGRTEPSWTPAARPTAPCHSCPTAAVRQNSQQNTKTSATRARSGPTGLRLSARSG